jgi:cyclomaltodextrinase / maltogenic alpha-amylase / neopullulanase
VVPRADECLPRSLANRPCGVPYWHDRKMSDWVEHCILWHVFPMRFVGAEPTRLAPDREPAHRLGRIEGWLDYLIELGASGLLLGPIFESGSHGYDTVDYYAIDRRLGDEQDFAALVDAAHQRGIRVVLDGVFNHVGREFAPFRRAIASQSAPEGSLFRLYWNAPGDEPDYEHFEGHKSLVTLNHRSPAVVDLVVDVMCHWLERGADGWRLDAAYAVFPGFWAQVLPRVRARFPEVYVVGEVIHGDYPAFVADSGVEAVTQYELWKATWSAINDLNLFELAWALKRHDEMLATFVPLTFLGNHDVTRIATLISDPTHLAHALVVLFTVGGTPCVYSGDEQGFRGHKTDRPGGDDEVRPVFPESPAELSTIGRPIYDLHAQLIGLRRRTPWLHHARIAQGHVANEQLVYRCTAGDRTITVALNLAGAAARVPAPGVRIVLVGGAHLDGSGDAATIILPAHGWAVLDH